MNKISDTVNKTTTPKKHTDGRSQTASPKTAKTGAYPKI